MAKTVTDAEMKAFRKKKRDARKRLNAMLAAGQITGAEFNKRVSQLGKLKVGQAIPASITKPSKPSAAAASAGNKKPSMTVPTPPPAGRKKKKSMAVPTPPPKGRKTPKKEKLYTAINVNTGKPDFNKPKVTAAERLKQEDKYKKRQAAQKNVDTILKNLRAKKGKK